MLRLNILIEYTLEYVRHILNFFNFLLIPTWKQIKNRIFVHTNINKQESYPGKDNILSGYFISPLRGWLRQSILKGPKNSKNESDQN